ncbi:c-type cytochrome biogenesis protein CcsB [Cyanobacterium sp. uoEpiScrs1]|uniref:c-type cytochrome biogenesis protein CcsB n=1 Tax=Cyanobacterium sp. uoEpiScrs1 TaxID=2976343 RepID=UPI002269B8B3|nr:c-type cytochrome biogenesis protein CcsB [Cyanobacterium sp. uoEpiScrs1]
MNLITLQNFLDNTSFLILFFTMLIYWTGAAFRETSILPALGTTGIAIANLSITALLAARWLEGGYFPLSNLYESLFFLAWGVTAVHLIAEKISASGLVGVVTTPITMIITAFAALSLPADMQTSAPLVPALKSNWLMMHVSVMMLSYATLIVGSMLAITFLVVTYGQDIELRGSSVGTGSYHHKLNRLRLSKIDSNEKVSGTTVVDQNGSEKTTHFERGDSQASTADSTLLSLQRLSLADVLDNVSYRIIGLGFPLLTIGIIAGAVWANEVWGSYWSWDPKETWALITWLVFAAYLHSRITRGWQGRKPAILAASGFIVVWVCYLGVNLLGKGLHSYGWFF